MGFLLLHAQLTLLFEGFETYNVTTHSLGDFGSLTTDVIQQLQNIFLPYLMM